MSRLVPETSPAKLQAQLQQEPAPLLVDVRTPGEFAEGHIEGAINIPLNELPQRLQELPQQKSRPIVTICRSARRTIPATQLLLVQGYQEARQLAGGMNAWHAEGLPTVS